MRFDLDALNQPGTDGAPMLLLLASIEEDPSQPRTEFDDEPLRQLADSIAQRGVLQNSAPTGIFDSVRPRRRRRTGGR